MPREGSLVKVQPGRDLAGDPIVAEEKTMLEGIVQSGLTEDIVWEKGQLTEILKVYEGGADNLIPLLQRIQRVLGYVPEWALLEVSDLLGLPSAKVFGVVTFYTQFRLQPIGDHIIRLCRGTACHVRRSHRILQEIQSHFQVGPGETTRDRRFTLEVVACFGSCALAPVMVVDDIVYGRMNPLKALEILDQLGPAVKEPFISNLETKRLGRSQWTMHP